MIQSRDQLIRDNLKQQLSLMSWMIQREMSLIITLRGQVLNILQTIFVSQQTNYSALISKLKMRYAHLKQVYKAQIKHRNQNIDDRLQEFESDIARLVR